ncbi:MAG: tRNA pseudouridine(38-40) synthase TruA [Bacteroidetes bacterium]|nr:tRNA pseudouridine(38-40) synthase TruA [Bacteroidota bacterium]
MRYFIHLNYNGKNYNGWQKQIQSPTIQETIESALSTLFQTTIEIVGCGRTDSGVNAQAYYAHFDAPYEIAKKILPRINKLLPGDIGIYDFLKTTPAAHSRFDATARTYKYFIHFQKNAFLQDRSYWLYNYDFNLTKMNDAAAVLLSYSDFSTFEKKGSDNKTSICSIKSAKWEVLNDNQWCFTITADRFLRNMVRRIVGTLLMVGLDRLTIEEMKAALNKHDILEVNIAPPAHGLFLWQIDYPANLFIE